MPEYTVERPQWSLLECATIANRAMSSTREKAREGGLALIAAKAQLPHGAFQPWLAENCPDISERTAQHWMAFARGDTDTLRHGESQMRPGGAFDAEVAVRSAETPEQLDELHAQVLERRMREGSIRRQGTEAVAARQARNASPLSATQRLAQAVVRAMQAYTDIAELLQDPSVDPEMRAETVRHIEGVLASLREEVR